MAAGELGAGRSYLCSTFFSVVISPAETGTWVVEWYRRVAPRDVRRLCILVCRPHFSDFHLAGLARSFHLSRNRWRLDPGFQQATHPEFKIA